MTDINKFTPYRAGMHSIFTSEENRCVHVGLNVNKNNVRQYQVDGGVYKKDTTPTRCDYLLINDDKRDSYYIELKGSDIEKAIQQVDVTVEDICPSLGGYQIYRRIIYHTKSHSVNGSKALSWKKKHKGFAVIKQGRCEERM